MIEDYETSFAMEEAFASPFFHLSKALMMYVFEFLSDVEKHRLIAASTYLYATFSIQHVRRIFLTKKNLPMIPLGRIFEKIASPYHQLSLKVFDDILTTFDLRSHQKYFRSLHQLEITAGLYYSVFHQRVDHIHSLKLCDEKLAIHYPEIEEILRHFADLSQRDSMALRSLSLKNLQFMLHIPNISYLETLEVEGIPSLTTIPVCKTLRKLIVRRCPSFRDVSQLGKVPELQLYSCESIEDITALTRNRTVVISECTGILDYTNSFEYARSIAIISPHPRSKIEINRYRHVSNFNVTNWKGNCMTNGSFLRHLRCLTLNYCKSLVVSSNIILKLWKLTLSNCSDLTTVVGFGSVAMLTLEHLPGLQNLVGLGITNRSVTVRGCNKITDFSPLKYVPQVKIISCEGFGNGYDVHHCKQLLIEECPALENVDMFGHHVEEVELRNCMNIRSYQGLQTIPSLTISKVPFHESIFEAVQGHRRLILPLLWVQESRQLLAKLLTSYNMSLYIESFLTQYQADQPLALFLARTNTSNHYSHGSHLHQQQQLPYEYQVQDGAAAAALDRQGSSSSA